MIVGYTAIYRLWDDTKDRHLTPNPDTPKGLYAVPLAAWEAIYADVAGEYVIPSEVLNKLQKVEILAVVEDRSERPQMTKRR